MIAFELPGSFPLTCLYRVLRLGRPGACGKVKPEVDPSHADLATLSHLSRKMATNFLVHEKIWFDKFKYDDAERRFYEQMNGPVTSGSRQVRTVLRAGGTMWARDMLVVRAEWLLGCFCCWLLILTQTPPRGNQQTGV